MEDGKIVINTKINDAGLKSGVLSLQDTTIAAMRTVKGALATLGIGIGVATAVRGIQQLVSSTSAAMDRVDKLSQKIGISKRAFQEWDYVLSQNGVAIEGLQMGVKTLSDFTQMAASGNKTAIATFDELGVSIYDVNGKVKDQETLFGEVFTALSAMEVGARRTALANDLLGKSASELAPALNAGSTEIERLRDEAYRLGLVLDDVSIAAGVRFGDRVDDLKRSLQGAASRAVVPFLDTMSDLAVVFTEKAVPAIENFLTVTFKVLSSVPPIAGFMYAAVRVIMAKVGEALQKPWDIFKGFVKDFAESTFVQKVVDIVMKLSGDLYEGLKKGVQSGDWSDFFKAGLGVAQFAIGISATLNMSAAIGTSLWAFMQTKFAAAGFATAGLTSGIIAAVSIGIAISQAIDTGDFESFSKNIVTALIAGFAVAGLTGSPKAGILAFTASLSFKLGEILFPETDQFSEDDLKGMTDSLKKAFIANVGGVFTNNVFKEMAEVKAVLDKTIWGWDWEKQKLKMLYEGTTIGKAILDGLGIGLSEIDEMSKIQAGQLLETFKDELGIKSPSKEFTLVGNQIMQGLVNGLLELFPELAGDAEAMVAALETIWGDGEYKAPVPGATGGSNAGGGSSGSGTAPGESTGFKKFGEEMQEKAKSWSGYFYDSANTFSNAFGNAFMNIGASLASQKKVIADLSASITEMEDSVAESYDDLKDAQDEYSDAVLSGDSEAIKNADKRLKQQQKIVDGYEKQLKAIKEEKKSVESGEEAWKSFGSVVLSAIADVLEGLAGQLAAQAVSALIGLNFVGAALATAGAIAAYIAAGAVRSSAGSYAVGGIVPQVSGVPTTGDQVGVRVNPGELILNSVQQQGVAAQLATLAEISNILGNSAGSRSSSITVNLSGASFYGLDEEKVGRAIYGNIRTLQHEGVLPAW